MHGPDGISFIAMDEGELVLVDTMTKYGVGSEKALLRHHHNVLNERR